jgi:phospholipid/cholesterol/gamma-HCH transport system substrate-binding protein
MTPSRSRRLVVVAAAASVLVVGYLLLGGGSGAAHRFTVTVPAAANIVTGNQITAGGKPIGSVTGIDLVDGGHAARLDLRITDESYWPVARDSTIEVRLGGTVSFVNRYLLLTPGKPADGLVAAGGELPPGNVKIPVELDTVISKLGPKPQRGIKRLIGNGAAAVHTAGPDLRRAIGKAPPVLVAAAGTLGDLAKDRQQLAALVRSTSRVVDGVDRSAPDLRVLLDGLAQTFTGVAAEQDALKRGLSRLPSALVQTRTTLGKADVTLRDARKLTDRISPGITQLRRVARPLTSVLAALRTVTPDANRTLRAVGASGVTSSALRRVADVTPLLTSVTRKATDQLKCIRPYIPELVGFGTSWGDFLGSVDNRDHLARATVQNFLPANFNSVPSTAQEVVDRNPGIDYGFPRAPGALAGQPWYLPECGAGKDATDPSKDKESNLYKANRYTLPIDLRNPSKSSLIGGAP